jgi:hypothetical protein
MSLRFHFLASHPEPRSSFTESSGSVAVILVLVQLGSLECLAARGDDPNFLTLSYYKPSSSRALFCSPAHRGSGRAVQVETAPRCGHRVPGAPSDSGPAGSLLPTVGLPRAVIGLPSPPRLLAPCPPFTRPFTPNPPGAPVTPPPHRSSRTENPPHCGTATRASRSESEPLVVRHVQKIGRSR